VLDRPVRPPRRHPPLLQRYRYTVPDTFSRKMSRLFVSDVHLDAGAPEANEQFLEFLRTTRCGCGSALHPRRIFSNLGGGRRIRTLPRRAFCEGLRALTASGVGCSCSADKTPAYEIGQRLWRTPIVQINRAEGRAASCGESRPPMTQSQELLKHGAADAAGR